MTADEAVDGVIRFFGARVTADRRGYYAGVFAGYGGEAQAYAVRRVFEMCRTFPTVAEVRTFLKESGGTSTAKGRGSMPPDVAAGRARYALPVELPVRPDKDAQCGQRWGVKPRGNYDDVSTQCREAIVAKAAEKKP